MSPNPVKDILRISGLPNDQQVIINIVNRNGNLLKTVTGGASTQNLKVCALHSDVYYIKIVVDGNIQRLSFIKD